MMDKKLTKLSILLGALTCFAAPYAIAQAANTSRVPVLAQVAHPHTYYWREMYMPQLTSGPSAASFSPDGQELVYSMQGSLWRQGVDSDVARQLTAGPGYDFQPDWSADGKRVVFTRQHGNALNLFVLNLETGRETALTQGDAVNLEPRWSPDGSKLAFVSSKDGGYLGLYVADFSGGTLKNTTALVAGEVTERDRYYYSQEDHAVNPSWSPDGDKIYYLSNPGVAWGSGDIWAVDVNDPDSRQKVLVEETTWAARPEMAHDGKRLMYSSYQGRQWHQLWLTTPDGLSPLPLTFGEYDLHGARWSPDDRHVVYTSNEDGNLSLWLHTFVGGARKEIKATERVYKVEMNTIAVQLKDDAGAPLAGRVMVSDARGRHYAPDDALVHADDYLDPATSNHENHYFHCNQRCDVRVPAGEITVRAASGYGHLTASVKMDTRGDTNLADMKLTRIGLDDDFGQYVSADLHVHMNYGGQYKQTLKGLAAQARAEGLDVIYNLIVNKEQRITDINHFKTESDVFDGVTIFQAQEYHTSYWGHMSFLHLDDHYLTPDFSSYRHTALASPYPSNMVMNDLARAQGAVTGYVHPFDKAPDPDGPAGLSHSLAVDVVLGKTDFLEVVAFANHEETASVWYRFLNLGYPLAAGAGTDAMTNYASLRGPVGLNRVFLQADPDNPESMKHAIRTGNGFVTNGPQVGLLARAAENDAYVGPGSRVHFAAGGGKLHLDAALASFAPIERLEVVQNGKVIKRLPIGDGHRSREQISIDVTTSGWVLLRAVNKTPHPFVQDLYTYATTNPIWVDVDGAPQHAPEDARYFLGWLERVKENVSGRQSDINAAWELESILADISAAQARLQEKLDE